MSKKKVTLEEAKKILESDKIFYNGNRKFNVVDVGRYHSGITIEVPQEWTIDKKRKPESPISYISSKELTDGMNIDFDGDASILLGKYRLSKNGRPVFGLTEPTKASDTLVKVNWGGSFNRTRGQYKDYAKEVGASFFTRRSSNGGGAGNDYWILPVDFVRDMEPRDVSTILANIEQKENERIAEIDDYIKQEDLEIKNSVENRERLLEQIQPIIEKIQTFNPEFKYEANSESFKYQDLFSETRRYTDNLISQMTKLLERLQNEKNARNTYKPMYQEMESTLSSLNISISYHDTYVRLKDPTLYFHDEAYNYSQEGYHSFINDVTQYQEKIAQEQEEARRKAEELRRAVELKRKKEEAKKMGYPEKFEFWNRLYGATHLGHAYVIENDGTIREPDYNNLRNINHMHNYSDWKNYADGTQGYEQILPGKIIVTYTKDYTAVPYIFNVEWADGEISEAQLEVICDELSETASFAKDTNGQKIMDINQWVTNAIKTKAMKCQKQLIVKEQNKDKSFAEEIIGLAEEKVTSKDKNIQAKQLTQAYEDQLEVQTNQPSLEDD